METNTHEKALNHNLPEMEIPARYRIVVGGKMMTTWSSRLGGMSITDDSTGHGIGVTALEGKLADQGALAGILNTLIDNHYPIISVEYLGNEKLHAGPNHEQS